jgi:hypothetical protein
MQLHVSKNYIEKVKVKLFMCLTKYHTTKVCPVFN